MSTRDTRRRHELKKALDIVVPELLCCGYDDSAFLIVTSLAMSKKLNTRDETELLRLVDNEQTFWYLKKKKR